MAAIEDPDVADQPGQMRPEPLGDPARLELLLLGIEKANLDQLVAVEGAVELADHRLGQTLAADVDHRLQGVGETAQVLALATGELHGGAERIREDGGRAYTGPMSSFVLVHGSGQNAGCWSRVAARLRARGHAVAAPDLPKRAADWRLEDHAARIAQSVTQPVAGPGTVVVAHSFSGVFLPLVPRTNPCGLLVFLAAVVPEPGKSVRDQLGEDGSMFSEAWLAAGPRWFDKSQEENLAREFLFHDCDEATVAWALGTMELYDTRPLVTQPAPFRDWPAVPAVSIVPTEDRTLTPGWGRRISRRVLGREAIEIEAGHCPHMSRPREVADLLERLASRQADV